MKLSFKLFRCVSVPQHWFESILESPGAAAAILDAKLRRELGPFPSRLKIWWSKPQPGLATTATETVSDKFNHVVIGIEVLAFDLTEQGVPCGGVCSTDPLVAQDIDRVDGALESELNRWGITTEFEGFEWRAAYDLRQEQGE